MIYIPYNIDMERVMGRPAGVGNKTVEELRIEAEIRLLQIELEKKKAEKARLEMKRRQATIAKG